MGDVGGVNERFGRVLRIAALGAAVTALAAVIAPRLAFSDSATDGRPAAASLPSGSRPMSLPALDSAQAIDGPLEAVPAAPTARPMAPPIRPGAAEGSAATSLPPAPPATTTTATHAPVPVDSGAVTLALIGVHAGRLGPPQQESAPGDSIGWHFRVANTGDEYLWGVFVYLELHGPVSCTARRLAVGATTDCWAETRAEAGANEVEAWVTAWTERRMVSGRLSHRVAAGAS